ncbi:MAG TPA: esterase, partial [Clostridiaceae bacterium]|nr:esterase [Clostridiaceae bacterium]
MRKLLAFLLAFTIAFSAAGYMDSYAAASVSAEVNVLVDIGMLVGDGNGVTREYTQKEMTRLTAAISILKLRGLYDDAVDYEGYANFADSDEVKWAEGKNIMAYLKANPNLGFIGDERG